MEPFTVPTGNKCKILYAGVVDDYRYDTLLKAIQLIKETMPDVANRLCFSFIGEGIAALAKNAEKLGLTDIIHTMGPRPFAEVAALQREAHALLVLGRPATKPGYELFAGAKLFGYLKAGRPIVGVLPSDETKKVLQRVGARTVADVDSVSAIITVLRLLIDNWSAGTLSSLLPDHKVCETYSSERQTATLVRAFEGMQSEDPFVPGAQAVPPSLRYVIENKEWLDGGG
jgi:glycosyltransferase involved in cell wall biosynthesis